MQPNLSKVSLNTTNSHRAPYAVRSDTERDPIGGGRNLIGRRTQNDDLLRKKIRLLLCLISETYVSETAVSNLKTGIKH